MNQIFPALSIGWLYPAGSWLACIFILTASPNCHGIQSPDELTREVTWKPATAKHVQKAFEAWLTEIDSPQKQSVMEGLTELLDQNSGNQFLDVVIQGIEIQRPELSALRVSTMRKRVGLFKPDFSKILNDQQESKFVKNHLRLLYARWLAQNDLYDEANTQFELLTTDDVLDPATLLFYHGIVQHQLLLKEKCVVTIKRLLEQSDQLPRRFAMVGKIVLADIAPLKADSMDEISRMMADIRRRQSLYRAGIKVRDQEQDVIKKLDKLIEELEQQKKKQQQQQSGNTMPTQPMQDSQSAAGQGSGAAQRKNQVDGGDWGNLPPAQRAAALAEMAKDLPPHYRAVIEEYFRKLARDKDNQ